MAEAANQKSCSESNIIIACKYLAAERSRGGQGRRAAPPSSICSEGITWELLGNSQHCKTRSLPKDPKGFVCFQPYLLSCFKSLVWKLLLGLRQNTARSLEEFAGV